MCSIRLWLGRLHPAQRHIGGAPLLFFDVVGPSFVAGGAALSAAAVVADASLVMDPFSMSMALNVRVAKSAAATYGSDSHMLRN